jgi:membrane protease YdiL (CAAX protease family)
LKGSRELVDDATMRWLVGGTIIAAILGGAAVAFPCRGPLIAPPRGHRFVPWSGLELALALFVYFLFQYLPGQVLLGLGLIEQTDPTKAPTPGALYRLIWGSVLVGPWYVPLMLLFFWRWSKTKPRHFGLTTWRWRESIALAYSTAVIIVPMVYGVNFLAHRAAQWTGSKPHPHPLQSLIESGVSPMAIALTAIQATLIAPLVEEFLFRGVMLTWLSQRWWGGYLAMAGGVAIGWNNFISSSGKELNWTPLGFVVVACLLAYLFTNRPRPEQWARRAIAGTAILFAMLHVEVWPSPVPLLLLGLALGWCAYRARNLLASFTLHAIFNAVSILLILGGLEFSDRYHKTVAPAPNVTESAAPKLPPRLAQPPSEPPPPTRASGGRAEGSPKRPPGPGDMSGPMK